MVDVTALDPATVAVIIPTLNEREYIAETLAQIIEHDSLAAKCMVIVADGGSTDGTQDVVTQLTTRYGNLVLLNNPGRTQAAAVNMLLDQAYDRVDVLIRCDAHARYPTNFVTDLVAAFSEKQAASVVIPMDAKAGDDCFQRGLAWISDTKLGAGGSPHRGGVASRYVDHGHHAAFRMSVFRDLCGYDTRFIANEDAEYDRRVILCGEQIWLESAIRIDYFPRRTAKALWRQYYRYGQGRAQTCFKHRVPPKLRQMIPVMHIALLAFSILILPFSIAGLAWPIIYTAVVLAAGGAMVLKHKSVCGFAGSLGLAVMHLSWGLGFIGQAVRESASGRKATSQ
ncbi:glycosyltransferase family 2 protein [Actibacterium sp. 188UL27-1]|uniref:glycosyltransferase family 2 protein n=1 Tax=Actibacterium sp. 188UL27-1 TaxID=2786961 RepID=UPI001955F7C4|nr:glycosyltransferase family 2 protein [Actibacterium sp. 188UL27-1]MBM7069103.1 glycosyltransferase family 2 protein [Actibacterium sp. 188UL27-1]